MYFSVPRCTFQYTDHIEMTNLLLQLYIEMRNPKKSQADITPWNYNGFPTNSVNHIFRPLKAL